MLDYREEWASEAYNTRHGNNRVSGKNTDLLNDYDVFMSEWASYVNEYSDNFSMEQR